MWGLCELAQCAWCGLGEGQMQSSTWTFQWCTKHPQGPEWRCTCMSGWHGGWFLVVAGTSWGGEKRVGNLSGFLPKPVRILLINNEYHAYMRAYSKANPG